MNMMLLQILTSVILIHTTVHLMLHALILTAVSSVRVTLASLEMVSLAMVSVGWSMIAMYIHS